MSEDDSSLLKMDISLDKIKEQCCNFLDYTIDLEGDNSSSFKSVKKKINGLIDVLDKFMTVSYDRRHK